ncbi:type II toxin-antitoxin system HicA family toxin [Candidatus Pacearchaeota archaeon]|nr:type II toxin-antitoxin system HicA family toxin [Candidatus Pacearchaeota archaeon]
MPKLPRISGVEVIKILTKFFGFRTLRQRGSHVTLTNDLVFLTVPLHPELDRGTLLAILRDAHISREDFLEYV